MKELLKDTVYENAMIIRLDQSKELLQNMVTLWNALGYRPCDSASMLFDLAFNPTQMIEEGKGQKQMDGDNLPAVQKEAYLNKLVYKNDNAFRLASAKVQQDPYSERGQNLWLIKNSTISINKKEADEILKQRSVIATNEQQIKIGEQIIQVRDHLNEINKITSGNLKVNVSDLFNPDYRPGGDAPMVLNLNMFRRILSFV